MDSYTEICLFLFLWTYSFTCKENVTGDVPRGTFQQLRNLTGGNFTRGNFPQGVFYREISFGTYLGGTSITIRSIMVLMHALQISHFGKKARKVYGALPSTKKIYDRPTDLRPPVQCFDYTTYFSYVNILDYFFCKLSSDFLKYNKFLLNLQL